MPFNSLAFLSQFLPLFLAAFWLAGRFGTGRTVATAVVLAASLVFFQAAGGWYSLGIGLASLSLTYLIGSRLCRSDGAGMRRVLFFAGLLSGLLPLIFFKYKFAFSQSLPGFWADIGMPLALSFLVFQQVTFLFEMNRDGAVCPRPLDYFAAVLFFPKLVCGPLTSVCDVARQIGTSGGQRDARRDLWIGATYLSLGLFKKAVLSDPLRPAVDAVYSSLAAGATLPMAEAWTGLLLFFLMLYFDFSGYTDIAIGLARACGIVLPGNFKSPLKACSLADFWSRWHATLTKFLMGVIYNPLALWRTRASMRTRPGRLRMFFETAAFPAVVTMLVSGIWHGGGWSFIIFGLLHGLGLTVNQAWRQFKAPRLPAVAGWAATFVFVMVSLIFFRAADVPTAARMLASLAGVGAEGAPRAASLPDWRILWVAAAAAAIALGLPNSHQIMGEEKAAPGILGGLRWAPTLPWAAGALACAVCAVALLWRFGSPPFVYSAF
ncbi:MBOAT family O-acyltransferase [Oleispirillum naphthae]|uniref:MBOAT family O-acyltransferase n=1 Tax=Oleispirillum naphthae TaxID=2838853 RepID=UPI0030823C24